MPFFSFYADLCIKSMYALWVKSCQWITDIHHMMGDDGKATYIITHLILNVHVVKLNFAMIFCRLVVVDDKCHQCELKGHWTSVTSFPPHFFQKKIKNFYQKRCWHL